MYQINSQVRICACIQLLTVSQSVNWHSHNAVYKSEFILSENALLFALGWVDWSFISIKLNPSTASLLSCQNGNTSSLVANNCLQNFLHVPHSSFILTWSWSQLSSNFNFNSSTININRPAQSSKLYLSSLWSDLSMGRRGSNVSVWCS